MAVLVFEIQVSDFLGPLFRPPLDEVVEDVGDDWTLHPAMDVMPRLPGTLKQLDQIRLPSPSAFISTSQEVINRSMYYYLLIRACEGFELMPFSSWIEEHQDLHTL